MEQAPDPGTVILERIADLEVQRAAIEARIADRMLQFADLRRAEADRHDDPRQRDLEASFAADELGVVLHQPTRTVQVRLAQSRRVRGRLPNTWLAHTNGSIDAYRVSLIASAADKLRGDNHALIELDHVVPGNAARQTTAQLKGWLNRFVARSSADASKAARAEKDKRGVWLNHGDDGMTWLHAYLPTTDAMRIDALLTERTKALPADDRTLDHKRADEMVRQMFGHVDGHTTSSRAVIGITIPATSLAGLSDEPGESFDGAFALPTDLVRDLANQPGTLFHRVITDPAGQILDITELGRFPSARLKTAIDIRDGTCVFPTCSRPSMECDKDHRIPHPDGPTSGANLRGLCRRHHRIKTHLSVEPTDYVMRVHEPSRREHDFAIWLTGIDYAA